MNFTLMQMSITQIFFVENVHRKFNTQTRNMWTCNDHVQTQLEKGKCKIHRYDVQVKQSFHSIKDEMS